MDVGILIARVRLGLAIGAHGAQKLFGWFSGHSLKGTGAFFEGMAITVAVPMALVNVALRRSPQTKAHA
jgi:putative oxidoreductase